MLPQVFQGQGPVETRVTLSYQNHSNVRARSYVQDSKVRGLVRTPQEGYFEWEERHMQLETFTTHACGI